ncbi:MAG TPA: hypothetical protein VNF50_05845 [Acidimicrobiales bacterium]|nr:hypothetical protein [Acidimicrobiales bacterium]
MNETTWERYGAASGLAFVVLFILSVFIVPMPPHLDASTGSVAAYFMSHAKALLLTEVLTAFAAMAFLWFLGHLRHVMQRAEAGHEELSPIVMVAGVALAGLDIMSMMPTAIMAFMAHRGDALAGTTVRMMWDWNQVGIAFVTLSLGLFLIVASMAMVRKEMVAAWLGWAGMVLAALCWIDGIVMFFQLSYSSFDNALGLVTILGFALWMAVASITMLQRPEVVRHAALAKASPVVG